jgi:hypothetical protein
MQSSVARSAPGSAPVPGAGCSVSLQRAFSQGVPLRKVRVGGTPAPAPGTGALPGLCDAR